MRGIQYEYIYIVVLCMNNFDLHKYIYDSRLILSIYYIYYIILYYIILYYIILYFNSYLYEDMYIYIHIHTNIHTHTDHVPIISATGKSFKVYFKIPSKSFNMISINNLSLSCCNSL